MELPQISIIRKLIYNVGTFLYFSRKRNIFNISMKRMLYLSLVQSVINHVIIYEEQEYYSYFIISLKRTLTRVIEIIFNIPKG